MKPLLRRVAAVITFAAAFAVQAHAQTAQIEFRATYASSFARITAYAVDNAGTAGPITFTNALGSCNRNKEQWSTVSSMAVATDTCPSISITLTLRTKGYKQNTPDKEMIRGRVEIIDAETGAVLRDSVLTCGYFIDRIGPGTDTSATRAFKISTSGLAGRRIQVRLSAVSWLNFPIPQLALNNNVEDADRIRVH